MNGTTWNGKNFTSRDPSYRKSVLKSFEIKMMRRV